MRTEMITHSGGLVAFLLAVAQAAAQSPTYLVLQRGAMSVAYYSAGGELQAAVPTGSLPHEMVLSRDGRFLYVTDGGTNTVTVIDVAGRRKFAEISLGEFHSPHGIDLDPATGNIAVTTSQPDRLLLVDPVKRVVLKHFPTKGNGAGEVTFGPGAQWAYVGNGGSSNVSAVNLRTGEVKLIPTGGGPGGSVLSRDGRELYVCVPEAEAVSVIDTARRLAVANIPTGKGPVRIVLTADGTTLVYALMPDKKIGLADARNRRQVDYIGLPAVPVSIALSPDGGHGFAAIAESDKVYVFSIKQKRIVQEINTAKGAGPVQVLQVR